MTENIFITVSEADALIDANLPDFGTELCPLGQVRGRVLRETVLTDRDQPPFDRVMMDGIAVSLSAWERGLRRYPIEAVHHAGSPARSLSDPNAAIEVMTGSMLPTGCDCVIPIESVSLENGTAVITGELALGPMQHVHVRGSDHSAGEALLVSGMVLHAPEIAVAASCGKAEVLVARAPKVGVISTGDELVKINETPLPHQIRQSNGYAVCAALSGIAGISTSMHHVRDDHAMMNQVVSKALAECDVVVLSGGVSMGKADFVPATLEQFGVRTLFHKVRQRPGKPLLFGNAPNGCCVFGLPGNPVSTMVTVHRYVLPCILKGMGAQLSKEHIPMASDYTPPANMTMFLPVRLVESASGEVAAAPCPVGSSGDFAGLVGTDGFVELPEGRSTYAAGAVVALWRWN